MQPLALFVLHHPCAAQAEAKRLAINSEPPAFSTLAISPIAFLKSAISTSVR
jgi:hypothetical protein